MSATQLAAWIVAVAASVALAMGALYLVSTAGPAQHARFGACAVALGLLALATVGIGLAVARPDGPAHDGRCGPGLYDNGGPSYNGPICIPWRGPAS